MRIRLFLLPTILGIFALATFGCGGDAGVSPTLDEDAPAAASAKTYRLGDSPKSPEPDVVPVTLGELKHTCGKDKREG